MDLEKEVTKEQLRILEKNQINLFLKRGEVVHWLTELDYLLSEIIAHYFIKDDQRKIFFNFLFWEELRFSTKIKLFKEITVPEKIRKKHSLIVKELQKLSEERNKLAHRLGMITLEVSSILEKSGNQASTDDKQNYLAGFRCKSQETWKGLIEILFILKGLNPDDYVFGPLVWRKISEKDSNN